MKKNGITILGMIALGLTGMTRLAHAGPCPSGLTYMGLMIDPNSGAQIANCVQGDGSECAPGLCTYGSVEPVVAPTTSVPQTSAPQTSTGPALAGSSPNGSRAIPEDTGSQGNNSLACITVIGAVNSDFQQLCTVESIPCFAAPYECIGYDALLRGLYAQLENDSAVAVADGCTLGVMTCPAITPGGNPVCDPNDACCNPVTGIDYPDCPSAILY